MQKDCEKINYEEVNDKYTKFTWVIVEKEIQTTETLIFTVKLLKKTAIFPRCGQTSHRLHQNQGYSVRDLLIYDKEVILKVNQWRFKCINCQKLFSKSLNFIDKNKSFTHRYAEKITNQVIHSDVNNVAENNKLTGDEVGSMVESVAEKIIPIIDVEILTRLGINKTSLAKDQGKFIFVLVDLDIHKLKLIGLVAERKRSGIEKVIRQWEEKVLCQIKKVSMDMTGNYKSLVKKLCPNADAIVDRFHVIKMLHEELNQARIAQRKAAESLKIKAGAKLFNSLKGSKYTLLKAENNLSNKQKQKLKQVKEASPLIGIMHDLKEKLRFLLKPSQNLGEGKLELIHWLKKAPPYYKKSLGIIKRWLAGIVGYFEQKTTNGIVEGINNKLKLLKRWGFGLRNFINFKIRALLLWHFPNN